MKRVLVSLLLLVAACGKSASKDGDKPAPEAKPVAAPVKPASSNTPWSFDPAAIQAKLQGVWVITNASCLGCKEAWKVEGDKVTVFHEGKEDTMTLTIESPCSLTTMKKNPDGSSEGSTSHYVLEGDTLHLGLGDAGLKTKDGIVACMSNGVFLLKDGTCKFYQKTFDKWDPEDATCSLEGTTFKASEKVYNYSGDMPLAGDLLMSDQLKNNAPAAKAKDWDDAKAQVAKK